MTGIKNLLLIILIFVSGMFFSETISAQNTAAKDMSAGTTDEIQDRADAAADSSPEQLPSGFINILLGQSMEELEDELFENPYFDYRGKPDVDMRISKERSLIECSGFSYVKKGYFQFYKDRLIIITVIIDETELDYFSFYTSLEKKYGKPDHLNPDGVYWDNGVISMTLEKPLSVKYMDKKSFQEIKDKSAASETRMKILKEDFIETF
jgi:hypothetical protein